MFRDKVLNDKLATSEHFHYFDFIAIISFLMSVKLTRKHTHTHTHPIFNSDWESFLSHKSGGFLYQFFLFTFLWTYCTHINQNVFSVYYITPSGYTVYWQVNGKRETKLLKKESVHKWPLVINQPLLKLSTEHDNCKKQM